MGTVVVGLDGSNASRRAFDVAVEEAAAHGHVVKAVHVHMYPMTSLYGTVSIDSDVLYKAAETWLAQELAELKVVDNKIGDVQVDPILELGHPGAKLTEAAEGADMLVVGSRGLGGFRGLFLGSVSTFCAHHLTCPLLVVPVDPDDD